MAAHKSAPDLPRIVLKDRSIPFSVLSLIPLATVEKYHVMVFEAEPKLLKLAIVHPEALKEGFYTALKDLGKKIDKEIELYQTDSHSFKTLLKKYKEGQKDEKEEHVGTSEKKNDSTDLGQDKVMDPPTFKVGEQVKSDYLKRIPYIYSKINRVVCVDFEAPNTFWFVSDEDTKAAAHEAVAFIESKNHITGHLIIIKNRQLDDLLEQYEKIVKQEESPVKPKAESDIKPEESSPSKPMSPVPPPPIPVPAPVVAPDPVTEPEVLSPDLHGAILSSDVAKHGLAGFLQKVSQGLSGEKKHEEEGGRTESPLPVPKPPQATGTPAAPVDPNAPMAVPQPKIAADAAQVARPIALTSDGEADLGKLLDKPVESEDELKDHIRKGFIPQIVAALVSFAIHEKASDIHIEAFNEEVRVRYRIDGQLVDIVKLTSDVHAAMVSRIKILSKLRLDETRVPQDGRFDVNFQNAQVDLRVSVMPTVHGEKVVLRILDKSKGISSLEELGIEGLAYQNLTKAINRPYGTVLATGPTGSGKSTSLYAILNRIATPNVNVVTLEDPVEYEMKGVNQSQIKPKIGYTFAEGLRSILRQDPNIIMVGEIRDGETATMATQAALTGHLVLSTLHTNDASGAIPRLTNMGIEPFLITSSLNVVMGQRLVRKICHNCKSEINLPQGVKDQISKDLELIEKVSPMDASRIKKPFSFFQGRGCEICSGKGYLGRVGIYEVLNMSDGIEELTLAHASAAALQEQAQKEGMITMYQDGLLKVISGITTLDEVLRETANK